MQEWNNTHALRTKEKRSPYVSDHNRIFFYDTIARRLKREEEEEEKFNNKRNGSMSWKATKNVYV